MDGLDYLAAGNSDIFGFANDGKPFGPLVTDRGEPVIEVFDWMTGSRELEGARVMGDGTFIVSFRSREGTTMERRIVSGYSKAKFVTQTGLLVSPLEVHAG